MIRTQVCISIILELPYWALRTRFPRSRNNTKKSSLRNSQRLDGPLEWHIGQKTWPHIPQFPMAGFQPLYGLWPSSRDDFPSPSTRRSSWGYIPPSTFLQAGKNFFPHLGIHLLHGMVQHWQWTAQGLPTHHQNPPKGLSVKSWWGTSCRADPGDDTTCSWCPLHSIGWWG